MESLASRLSRIRGRKVELRVPRRGKNKRLIDFASTNAAMLIRKRLAESQPLLELQNLLDLPDPPQRIEGFDISNTLGQESVGSVVVFSDGAPDKDQYRRYKIKSVEGPNDVASLKEVFGRCYGRRLAEGGPLPDLILVDGGKPQLHAAGEALEDAGLTSIPLVSLAKREELIFTPHSPAGIRLDRTSPALKLLQSIRDEAHRFAISLHRRRREKKSFASRLDDIPGLGPRRKTLLQTRYKSLEAIRSAPASDLARLVGRPAAEALLYRLNPPKK